jgi:hypothetical protein
LPSIIANAVAIALDAVAAVAGERAKYRRDNFDCELTWIPGRETSSDDAGDAGHNETTFHDGIVDPAELKLGGVLVTPQRGDLVIRADGSTYVVAYADGENVWRWTDQTHTRMRIHTVERSKHVDDESGQEE